MNKLLERQIRKYLQDEDLCSENFQKFLHAVSEAYDASDEDREMMERAFDLSSSEIAEAQKKVEEERAQFLSILSGIAEVVYVADPETYELLYMNGKAQEFWGNRVGDKCHKVLQALDEPCPFCSNDKIMGEHFGQTHVWEFENKTTRKWFRCIDRAIRWPDGRIVRFELAIDISDAKKAEEQLNQNIDELKRFHKMAVGRELRMIELKNEINALCRELSRDEPYEDVTG